jgi:hypothetical protein
VKTVVQRYHWFWWHVWRLNGRVTRLTGWRVHSRLDQWIYARR